MHLARIYNLYGSAYCSVVECAQIDGCWPVVIVSWSGSIDVIDSCEPTNQVLLLCVMCTGLYILINERQSEPSNTGFRGLPGLYSVG